MPSKTDYFSSHWPSVVRELSCELLRQVAAGEPLATTFYPAISRVLADFRPGAIAIVRQRGMDWGLEPAFAAASDFRIAAVPEVVISSALEAQFIGHDSGWVAAAIASKDRAPSVLVVQLPRAAVDQVDALRPLMIGLSELAALLLQIAGDQAARAAEIQRLTTMLEIAATWQQQRDWSELLESMAEAATQLLDAQRASIFLWDRRRSLLVGRPAMGVEGGQLEVDDSAGIVGAVLGSGTAKRWDASDSESEVNRKPDAQLQFQTTSLVAVPLNNRNGKRMGVFEVINKRDGRFTDQDEQVLKELAVHAAAAIENSQERERLAQNCDKLALAVAENVQVIGESPAIVTLRKTSDRVAKTDLSVLILGENGTGKEVLARSIHLSGARRHEPFIAVNCAAIVETLLESELFGHEKGAFTDAHEARAGKFEIANGGTLFLDEIGDMSLSGQAKLLRALEEKVVVRVGGFTPISTDVRVLAATNQPLAELVRQKRFREDLFFRLNVVTLKLPPLRERGDDILLLAQHFLEDFAHKQGHRVPTLSAAAARALRSHLWPGNIRELRNLIERVSYLCTSDVIQPSDLSFSQSPSEQSDAQRLANKSLNEATRQFQIQHIQSAIQRAGRNMTEAAAMLGLHRSNLYRKMKQLDLETIDD
ncbi:sigma 54-interacting transcriptional regulator [Rosistilla oblonga]|uniref:sigma 54-interacting transcriptional regulator n=1 Tax=Rosistilla oblonga TaxID=2527990 RepID=UPI003A9774FD